MLVSRDLRLTISLAAFAAAAAAWADVALSTIAPRTFELRQGHGQGHRHRHGRRHIAVKKGKARQGKARQGRSNVKLALLARVVQLEKWRVGLTPLRAPRAGWAPDIT